MRRLGLALALVALTACSAAPDLEIGGDASEVTDAPEVLDVLDDSPGLAARLVALSLAADAPGPLSFVVRVTGDDLAFELGAGPSLHTVPAPADGVAGSLFARVPFTLAPGETLTTDRLLLWAPGVTSATLTLAVDAPPGSGASEDQLALGPGTPRQVTLVHGSLRLIVATQSGLPRVGADTRIGLALDGTLAASDLAERVSGTIALKHYSGARRWLLRADCDSDAACAKGGSNAPCATTCACICETAAHCDCDFTALEATMQADALAAARRVVGGAEAPDSALARVRLHWVFKRSLGGSANCAANGELDVSPATYAAFFAKASAAALAINARLGFRLIDVLSPMNEANHPLQDGAHENAAGQPTLGGFAAFSDLIAQASCNAAGCCDQSRYIVPAPDVPALSAAALVEGHQVLVGADPAWAPALALSLYLDTEQRDPLQTVEGTSPAIVTPVDTFMRSLAGHLVDPAVDLVDLIVVDTYPGSWGAPWFESPDGIVHHMDVASQRIVRVDPVAAADAAIARATAASDAVAAVLAWRPKVILGEVGWSTFDGDEPAQATFARRLFDAAAARQARDPGFLGLLWFKSRDRGTFTYPTWTSAPNPLDPSLTVACDTELLGPIVCAAALLGQMDGQWGLTRADGSRKPAWDAFIERWARVTTAP